MVKYVEFPLAKPPCKCSVFYELHGSQPSQQILPVHLQGHVLAIILSHGRTHLFPVVISPSTKKSKGDSSVKGMKDHSSFVSSSRAFFPPKAKPEEEKMR